MRLQELERLIPMYAQQYYDGKSEISDEQFDSLTDELEKLDSNHWILSAPGWGYDPYKDTAGKKVQHLYQSVKGISNKPREFEDIMCKGLSVISAKLDGLTVVTYIEKGQIILALTRGNGETGKDVTAKVIHLLGSDKIDDKEFTGSVRGEAVISNEKWIKYLEKRPEAKNQRNSVSGIMNNTTEPFEDLEFVDYVLFSVNVTNKVSENYSQKSALYWLESQFQHVVEHKVVKLPEVWSSEEQQDFYNYYDKVRETYPCDGLIITENNLFSSSSKDNLIYLDSKTEAFKFTSEIKETLVIDIEWNLSKSNRYKPVLILEPINLGGATVQRVTALHAKWIVDNKIQPGKTRVKVMRSGEVIPKVMEVIN